MPALVAAIALPYLEQLDLWHCIEVNDASLRLVGAHCPRLRELCLEATATQVTLQNTLTRIALRANSLVPLMAYHTLWNIVQFLGRLWHVDFGRLIVLTLFVNIATAAVLWLAMLRRNKSSPIAPQAPPIPG